MDQRFEGCCLDSRNTSQYASFPELLLPLDTEENKWLLRIWTGRLILKSWLGVIFTGEWLLSLRHM